MLQLDNVEVIIRQRGGYVLNRAMTRWISNAFLHANLSGERRFGAEIQGFGEYGEYLALAVLGVLGVILLKKYR